MNASWHMWVAVAPAALIMFRQLMSKRPKKIRLKLEGSTYYLDLKYGR